MNDEDFKPGEHFLNLGRISLPQRLDVSDEMEPYIPEYDDTYHIREELLLQVAAAVASDTPLYLVGPKGCGKTSIIYYLASMLNQPVLRINMTSDTRKADFIGAKTLAKGKSGQRVVWEDGILLRAMRNNAWLVIDEIDAAPPEVLFSLHSVLEDARSCTIGQTGEVVKPPGEPAPLFTGSEGVETETYRHFRVFATANTKGIGDEDGEYHGTNSLNGAMLDRFLMSEVWYMDPDAETNVICARTGFSGAIVGQVMNVVTSLRERYREDSFSTPITTRQIELVFQLMKAMQGGKTSFNDEAFRIAMGMAITNKLPAEDAKAVSHIVQLELDIEL